MLVLWVNEVVFVLCTYSVLFFKKKTAYEMRISDWSSDVCSSDLKIDRAGFHRLHRHGDVAVPGQEDDGFGNTRRGQMLLEVEPARARHSYVEDETARAIEKRRFDEVAGRGAAFGLYPYR